MLKEFNILHSSTSRRSIANTLYQFAKHNALEWCHDHVRCCAKQKISSSVTVSTRVHVENIDFFMLMLISLYKHHPQKYESSKLQTRFLARRCRVSAKNIQIIISGYLYLPAVSVDKRDRSWKAAKRWKIVWSVERGGGKEQKLNSDTRAQKLIAFMSLRATFQFPFHRESSRKLLNGCWNSSRILRKKIVSSLFNLIWVLLCVLDCWWCDCFGVQRSFVRNKRKKALPNWFFSTFFLCFFYSPVPHHRRCRRLGILVSPLLSPLLIIIVAGAALWWNFFGYTTESEGDGTWKRTPECRSYVLGHIKPSHFSFVMKVVHTKMLEPKKKRDDLENEKKN